MSDEHTTAVRDATSEDRDRIIEFSRAMARETEGRTGSQPERGNRGGKAIGRSEGAVASTIDTYVTVHQKDAVMACRLYICN